MSKGIVIVISGQPGCGSTTTGYMLAKKLGLDFFSTGTYFKSMAESKIKKKLGWSSPTMLSTDYFASKEGSDKKLHEDIDRVQIEKAKKGNIVSEGKIAIRILKDIADFKVWLKAPAEVRAERYVERENYAIEEARKLIKTKDSLERENFRKIYGFDPLDQEKEADLVIDTGNKKPEDIVKLIISALKSRNLVA